MPTGNYSYSGDRDDARQTFAITEPNDEWGYSHRPTHHDSNDDEPNGVQAKEPDRQTSRRSQSGRGRSSMESDYDQENEPRSRGSSSRRGAQARRATERGQTARRSSGPTGRQQKKSRRGFAAMSPEQQREIARKGGLTVSRNRRHMADIGRIGGEHSHGGRRARR